MSKEKQCECCHEWWYGSDVKENLCPNCYYYFKQLKQQLEEKEKEIEKIKTKQKPIVMHSKENYYFLEEENIKLHFAQKQLAITELEKVKNYCDKQFNLWENNNFNETYDNTDVSHAYFEIAFIIKEKIKELKGE